MEAKNIDTLISDNQLKEVPKDVPANDAQPLPEAASETETVVAENKEEIKAPVQETERPQESAIDEYGNEIGKPQKVYSEEDVQRMIRERQQRSRSYYEEPQAQQVQPVQQQPQVQIDADEPWDVTLKKFIRNEFQETQKEQEIRLARERQVREDAQFQDKFVNGMGKYNDFRNVVERHNIPDNMLRATSHLDNPAAFIYTACKTNPDEVDRIANIQNPLVQAAEVGRLHERMVKARNIASSAPKPIEIPKGDMPQKDYMRQSIDQLVAQDAKAKFGRK